jgi:hypothetical protein
MTPQVMKWLARSLQEESWLWRKTVSHKAISVGRCPIGNQKLCLRPASHLYFFVTFLPVLPCLILLMNQNLLRKCSNPKCMYIHGAARLMAQRAKEVMAKLGPAVESFMSTRVG